MRTAWYNAAIGPPAETQPNNSCLEPFGKRHDMTLERQIKRHIIGARHACYATTLPGFETICRQELAALLNTLEIEKTDTGGVAFNGRLTDLYLANLHLRTAGRILLRIDAFKATNFSQLVKKTAGMAWARYLPSGAVPACKVATHRSRLYHSQAVHQRITEAIAGYWQSMGIIAGEGMGQTLYVRIQNDQVTLSLDSSGANLYQRGLKRHGGKAPLRETTAAAILLAAGYGPEMPLMDPMCGAGTFSLEAALMVKAKAPGMQRDFAFMQWPAFKPPQWRHLKKEAMQTEQSPPQPLIWASDASHQACTDLNRCTEAHGLQDTVRVRPIDFFDLNPAAIHSDPGLVVLNPPYGRRLSPQGQLKNFYRQLSNKLKRDYVGWRVALLAPKGLLDNTFLASLKSRRLMHGGLTLTLVTGRL